MYVKYFVAILYFVSAITLVQLQLRQNTLNNVTYFGIGVPALFKIKGENHIPIKGGFSDLDNERNGINKRTRRQSPSADDRSIRDEEVGWSNVNEEVDMVVPLVVSHLRKLGIKHWQLPDMKESISLNSLLISYEAGIFLTNGIVYNIAGIHRYGDAFMTYEGKSFLSRFNILIKSLQFEYNFLIKLMPIEGYGRIIGSLDDTIIFAELVINVADIKLKLNDFRIMKFSNIQVQLDQRRVIRQFTGLILSPITNLFRDRITTSISDGLKDQMQIAMDDFNDKDPLELRKFAKQIVTSLTGQTTYD